MRTRFPGVEARVQNAIDEFGGLLPVGQAVIVETDDSEFPSDLCANDDCPNWTVWHSKCPRSDVSNPQAATEHNLMNDGEIQSIAISGLGTGVGRLAPDASASQMRAAFDQFLTES